jgi:hypothetical protein
MNLEVTTKSHRDGWGKFPIDALSREAAGLSMGAGHVRRRRPSLPLGPGNRTFFLLWIRSIMNASRPSPEGMGGKCRQTPISTRSI